MKKTKGNTMKKITEYMTIFCAVVGTLSMISAVGHVEADKWLGAGVASLLGIAMFILSLYSQELYKEGK
jgi:hypothetical protein|tara:strand:- start:389 stop:595 length:207 start_codon:yes stop_codon:yes gene_type:complete